MVEVVREDGTGLERAGRLENFGALNWLERSMEIQVEKESGTTGNQRAPQETIGNSSLASLREKERIWRYSQLFSSYLVGSGRWNQNSFVSGSQMT